MHSSDRVLVGRLAVVGIRGQKVQSAEHEFIEFAKPVMGDVGIEIPSTETSHE